MFGIDMEQYSRNHEADVRKILFILLNTFAIIIYNCLEYDVWFRRRIASEEICCE